MELFSCSDINASRTTSSVTQLFESANGTAPQVCAGTQLAFETANINPLAYHLRHPENGYSHRVPALNSTHRPSELISVFLSLTWLQHLGIGPLRSPVRCVSRIHQHTASSRGLRKLNSKTPRDFTSMSLLTIR